MYGEAVEGGPFSPRGGSIDEVDDNVILHRAGTAHFPYMPKIVLPGLYSVYAFIMLFCMGNGRCLLGGELRYMYAWLTRTGHQSGRGNVG